MEAISSILQRDGNPLHRDAIAVGVDEGVRRSRRTERRPLARTIHKAKKEHLEAGAAARGVVQVVASLVAHHAAQVVAQVEAKGVEAMHR